MYIVNTLNEKKESGSAMVFFFFVPIRVLLFLDFSYLVYRHELNVYFSLEKALLAGHCFTILKYFVILWGKNRVYGYLTTASGWAY